MDTTKDTTRWESLLCHHNEHDYCAHGPETDGTNCACECHYQTVTRTVSERDELLLNLAFELWRGNQIHGSTMSGARLFSLIKKSLALLPSKTFDEEIKNLVPVVSSIVRSDDWSMADARAALREVPILQPQLF